MTFSETIDRLIPIYEEGMKAESYKELSEKYMATGICRASWHWFGVPLHNDEVFYQWQVGFGVFWFQRAYDLKYKPISEIIDQCIRPRLELLKRIQKDLKEKK